MRLTDYKAALERERGWFSDKPDEPNKAAEIDAELALVEAALARGCASTAELALVVPQHP